MQTENIIIRHLVTEKATAAGSNLNQYAFEVAQDANRVAIKQAVEQLFSVQVVSVNVLNTTEKVKRSRFKAGAQVNKWGFKKAIVRVKAGQHINVA